MIFFIIKFNFEITIPEFIEISFEKGGEVEAAQVSRVVKKEVAKREPVPVPEKIDIPPRPIVGPEEGKINIDNLSNLVPEEEVIVLNEDRSGKLAPEIQSPAWDEEKEIAEDSNIIPEMISEIGTDDEPFFKIEGKAAQRKILTKVVPNYPENLQHEAMVKIRFTVLPNGLIGEMIPVIKGNDLLERISLEAFKQWRFHPLPPDVPQRPEQGTITFKFLLR